MRRSTVTSTPDPTAIQNAIRAKYAEVAESAAGRFPYPTGRAGAEALKYDRTMIDEMPEEVLESFCGVGNPFTLGPINEGETVLDVGCGAGCDLVVASRLVGSSGRVCGIDMTEVMVEKARTNLARAGVMNGEVRYAHAESIPYDEGAFNVVISNGVLNLSPHKEKSIREIYRVLRSDGRLQFADIVLKADLPRDVSSSLEAWSD